MTSIGRRLAHLSVGLLLLGGAIFSGIGLHSARARPGGPPAATVPLGGFEPLAVDLLWLRAERWRNEHRLPEALAAYRLITEIEPHVGTAWAFLGAFVAWTDLDDPAPEAAYRWIDEGIRILHRGLRYNPDDPDLLFSLGLLYFEDVCMKPSIRAVAAKEMKALPEKKAVEVLSRVYRIEPKPVQGMLAAAEELLGERLLRSDDRKGALQALRRSASLYEQIGRLPHGSGARRKAARIRGRIGKIEGR